MTAVVAHRGAPDPSVGVLENTLAAFRRARDLGADGIELDARLTADGAIAVHHDPVLPGLGPLSELHTNELPDHVPLLEAALDAAEGLWVNVEIKNIPGEPGFDPDDRLARAVGQVLAGLEPGREVLVSSFWPPALSAVRAANPEVSTGLLYARALDVDAVIAAATERGCRALHPRFELATPDLVRAAHSAGLDVSVWTVNEPESLRTMRDLAVESVITDDVPGARAVLAADPA